MVTLILLGLVLALASWNNGAYGQQAWLLCLTAIGAIGLFAFARRSRRPRAATLGARAVTVLTVLLPLYVTVQTIPLPDWLVRIVSPARAQLSDLLSEAAIEPGWYAISVQPAQSLEHLLRFIGYALLLLMVREAALRRPQRNWALAAPFVMVAALIAFAGVSQVLAGESMATGGYANRNHFAGFLEMALPFALAFALAVLRSRRRRREMEMRYALATSAGWVVAVLLLAGVLLSLSRAGFAIALLGIVQVAALHFLLVGDNRLQAGRTVAVMAALVAVFVLGFIFLPSNALIDRFGDLATTEEITADSRVEMWGETVDLIGDYWLAGCGLGAFPSAFVAYRATSPAFQISFAHNDILQYAAELGVFGSLLAFGPVVVIWWRLLRRLEAEDRTHRRYLLIACLVSIHSIALHSLVDFNLYIPANGLAFSWVLGVATALVYRDFSRNVPEEYPIL